MRNLSRFISRQIGKVVSAKSLFNRNAPVFLPFYHVVSNQQLQHVLNYPYRNVEQFEKELDYYLKYFQPVELNEIQNRTGNKKVFHLTFDDGLKECAETIAPILMRKGIPATFFINTDFVDNKKLFHRYKASLILTELKNRSDTQIASLLETNGLSGQNILKAGKDQEDILNEVARLLEIDFREYLKKNQPYLSTIQIKMLQNDGFSIGAHSHNHPEFYKISEQEQLEQVKKSVLWVTKTLQPEIRAFSFPFTDSGVSASVLRSIKNEDICDVTFGTAGVKYDTFDFHFQRYPVEQPGSFVDNLKGEFVYFYLRKRIGKAIVKH